MKWLKKRWTKWLLTGIVGSVALLSVGYAVWQPGLVVRDGRDNRNQNALWMGHGWLGADSWFMKNHKTNQASFRAPANIRHMTTLCAQHGISDVYPHLCPTQPDGSIAAWDDAQVERFLDNAPSLRVLPWIGGRLDGGAAIESAAWRAKFVGSVKTLFKDHPRLAGVHVNCEPWSHDNAVMLVLLDELRAGLPPGKLLSVSAYPPPERFYPFRRSWSAPYFQKVAAHCDQMVLMSYDSAAQFTKPFEHTVADWTQTSLELAASSPRHTKILMGIPTYKDAGTTFGRTYHNPEVETPQHSLLGIHRGLSCWKTPPPDFQGIAIYSEWVTGDKDWATIRREWQ